MSSLFNAFRSDDESDAGDVKKKVAQSKKSDKPVASSKPSVTPAPSNKVEDPKPVSRNSAPKDKKKKAEIVEPSEVKDTTVAHEKRPTRGRGAKYGDRDGRGKRVFDRESAGQNRGLKKGGSGGHNWGNAETDAKAEAAAVVQSEVVEAPKEDVSPTEPVLPAEPVEEKAPEPATFTFEEFMKKKSEKRAGIAFENLKVNPDVEVVSGKVYAKKDRSANESETVFIKFGTDKESKDGKKTGVSRATKLKAFTGEDLGFTPKVEDRGEKSFRGGRGGFKGGFGGRGGAGATRGRRGGPALQESISSVSAFPSLSS